MVYREFVHPKIKGPNRVWYRTFGNPDLSRCSATEYTMPYSIGFEIGGHSSGEVFASARAARDGFDKLVLSLQRQGMTETTRSINRRVFLNPGTAKPTKFWCIWVDGPELSTQFGRLPRRASSVFGGDGKQDTKIFKTDADAKAAMKKLIVEKRDGGYKELWPRRASRVVRRTKKKV